MALKSIGIAGYMGSGKTTCCQMLAGAGGYRIIDGDREAKNEMIQNAEVQRQLVAHFGQDVLENNVLSFKKLGIIVFSDIEKLRTLNTIVHPLLLDRLHKTIFQGGGTVMVVDAALLPLWDIEEWFDLRLWIHASFSTRLERMLGKGLSLSEEEIRRRMGMQEILFKPPAVRSWSYIMNEGDSALLKTTVTSCIRNFYDKQHGISIK